MTVVAVSRALLGLNFLPDTVPMSGSGLYSQYVQWRKNSLVVLIVLWVANLCLLAYCQSISFQNYERVVQSLPANAQAHASGFPSACYYADLTLLISSTLQMVLVLRATIRWGDYSISRRLVKIAWLLQYIPFAVVLVYPYRHTVDWEAASMTACNASLSELKENQVLNLFYIVQDPAIRQSVSPQLLEYDPQPAAYCDAHRLDWSTQLSNDVGYLSCEYQQPPEQYCCDVRALTEEECTQEQAELFLDEAADFDDSATIALYSYLSNLQSVMYVSEMALKNSQYALGILMGVFAAKILIPSTLGLIAGFTSALLNVKLALPMSKMLSYLLLIATLLVLPMLAAFLSAIFQVSN